MQLGLKKIGVIVIVIERKKIGYFQLDLNYFWISLKNKKIIFLIYFHGGISKKIIYIVPGRGGVSSGRK